MGSGSDADEPADDDVEEFAEVGLEVCSDGELDATDYESDDEELAESVGIAHHKSVTTEYQNAPTLDTPPLFRSAGTNRHKIDPEFTEEGST